jgi:hypothetical protein
MITICGKRLYGLFQMTRSSFGQTSHARWEPAIGFLKKSSSRGDFVEKSIASSLCVIDNFFQDLPVYITQKKSIQFTRLFKENKTLRLPLSSFLEKRFKILHILDWTHDYQMSILSYHSQLHKAHNGSKCTAGCLRDL